jgi:hypothetical protein
MIIIYYSISRQWFNFEIVIKEIDMIVEFTLRSEEKNEALVMEKVLEISKHMKQLDFKMDHIDMMSEMGEMESLRLQMAMDRMGKMMFILSNLMKKMEDTASTITQNLK